MQKLPVIAIIGPGAIGEAIITGLLKNKVTTADKIWAAGPSPERLEALHEKYQIRVNRDNAEAMRQGDVVILSVKPQSLPTVMKGLKGQIPAKTLVLSVVAGATLEMITDGLEHESAVRCMPNTPAQIGEGITVWTATPAVTEEQLETTRSILGALGQHLFMAEEKYLDMATALSGSGPAYVFLFMEAMIDAGVHLGFPRRIAEQLVSQTLRGSVDYFDLRKDHPAQLRNEVTSPAGTSAAALYYLEKAGFRTAISRAIWAAYERSQELGRGRQSQAPDKN
ncbi:MAG TPA: pyrroline-5-carboxylate reductase [Longilinea sp.]|nr:pyrroline-5-carboxylate reductase [Longilinea sp.]